jgi:hypothetical protein
MTGWLAATPSLDPLLISIVEYQVELDRLKTRAVTGS